MCLHSPYRSTDYRCHIRCHDPARQPNHHSSICHQKCSLPHLQASVACLVTRPISPARRSHSLSRQKLCDFLLLVHHGASACIRTVCLPVGLELQVTEPSCSFFHLPSACCDACSTLSCGTLAGFYVLCVYLNVSMSMAPLLLLLLLLLLCTDIHRLLTYIFSRC